MSRERCSGGCGALVMWAGECPRCRKDRARVERASRDNKAYRQKRYRDRKCQVCGLGLDDTRKGKFLCLPCTKARGVEAKVVRDRRRAEGKCIACGAEREKNWPYAHCASCLEKQEDCRARRYYGLTAKEAREMRAQPCQICGKTPSVIDHCYTTGKVRGPLCSNHNTSFGLAGEEVEWFIRLAIYARKAEGIRIGDDEMVKRAEAELAGRRNDVAVG